QGGLVQPRFGSSAAWLGRLDDGLGSPELTGTTCGSALRISGSNALIAILEARALPDAKELKRRAENSLSPREISATRARMNVAHGSLIPGLRIWHWESTSQCGAPLQRARDCRAGNGGQGSERIPWATDRPHRSRRKRSAA